MPAIVSLNLTTSKLRGDKNCWALETFPLRREVSTERNFIFSVSTCGTYTPFFSATNWKSVTYWVKLPCILGVAALARSHGRRSKNNVSKKTADRDTCLCFR